MSEPRARTDWWLGVGLGLVATLVVGLTSQNLGFTRDEGYYFKAGELYWGWYEELGRSLADGEPLRAFSQAVIDKHWSYNHEHPALMKTLFAWSFGLHKLTGFPAGAYNALRFPAWAMAGLSVSLVFALTRTLLSRRASLLAALMWLAMPHAFWHMHVACFDIPIVAAHTWLVLAYLRWRRTWKGALAVGALFGLAAAVKHNVLPVPALLLLHWLLVEARVEVPDGARGVVLPRIPLVFFSLAVVGPAVYLLTWPWLWADVLPRLGAYLGFHLNHEHYPILYFGDLLTAPPFPVHFPFVMSAVTIPVPILVVMALGLGLGVAASARLLWHRFGRPGEQHELEVTRVPLGNVAAEASGSPAFLLVINALYPFFLIALPSTPIFGGTKHWMNGLPFLCVLGAWALDEAFARLEASGLNRAGLAFVIVGSLVVLPGAFVTASVWPYGLGSYNELIGFARGAANVGMQRTFWGYEPLAALPRINAETPRGGRIHFGDTNQDSWKMYRRARTGLPPLLREDIAFSNTVRGSSVASVEPQGEFKQQWIDVWNEWDDRTPDVILHAEGVPVLTVTFKEPAR